MPAPEPPLIQPDPWPCICGHDGADHDDLADPPTCAACDPDVAAHEYEPCDPHEPDPDAAFDLYLESLL